jgi:hypothetical protein
VASFFGPEAMAALQDIFSGFYQTDVEIYAKTSSENPFSDDGDTFATDPVRTKGWLRNQPDDRLAQDGSATVHPEEARLFLPIGVVVNRGDKVVIDGSPWSVIDHNRENTFKVTQRVAIKRAS